MVLTSDPKSGQLTVDLMVIYQGVSSIMKAFDNYWYQHRQNVIKNTTDRKQIVTAQPQHQKQQRKMVQHQHQLVGGKMNY